MFPSFLESRLGSTALCPTLVGGLEVGFQIPSLQQTLLPRSGAAERREDLTPYWRVLSQGCGLRIPSLGYGEFLLCVVEGGA